MKRLFIETDILKSLVDGLRDKELERMIKEEILKDPLKGDLIQGTGGLRKIRVAKRSIGKSGGYRVIYLDLPKQEMIYLFLLYDKSYCSKDISQEKG